MWKIRAFSHYHEIIGITKALPWSFHFLRKMGTKDFIYFGAAKTFSAVKCVSTSSVRLQKTVLYILYLNLLSAKVAENAFTSENGNCKISHHGRTRKSFSLRNHIQFQLKMLHGNILLVYPKGMKLIKQKYVCNMVSQNWNIVIMHNLCFASICICYRSKANGMKYVFTQLPT